MDKILDGKADAEIKNRAKAAKFDERLALLGLLIDGITEKLKACSNSEQVLSGLVTVLKNYRMEITRPGTDPVAAMEKAIRAKEKELEKGKLASSMSVDAQYVCNGIIAVLEEQKAMLTRENPADGNAAFALVKADFDKRTKEFKKQADTAGKQLSNVFIFCEEAFPDGQEMLILVTELTISYYGAHFISRYGCKEYFAHNKELLFYERQKEIITELENLEL